MFEKMVASDEFAEWAEVHGNCYGTARATLDQFSSYADLAGKKVLDAGCGLGGRTVCYAQNGCESIVGVGIRLSSHIARPRQRVNFSFISDIY